MSDTPLLEPPLWGRPLGGPIVSELTPSSLASHMLVADGGTLNGLTIRAASVAGTLHQLGAQPRQDSYHVRSGGRLVAAAVCDGVGSSREAEHAATVAAYTATGCALELFADLLSSPTVVRAVVEVEPPGAAAVEDASAARDSFQSLLPQFTERARVLVDRVAQTLLLLASDLNGTQWDVLTTLACVVTAPHAPGAPVVAIRVGDSNIRTLDDDSAWIGVFDSPLADGPSNRVDALPIYREPQVTATVFPDRGPLLLVSDGVDVPLAGSPTVASGLATRWLTPPTLASFVNDIQFIKVDAFDDRAAVALWSSTAT